MAAKNLQEVGFAYFCGNSTYQQKAENWGTSVQALKRATKKWISNNPDDQNEEQEYDYILNPLCPK